MATGAGAQYAPSAVRPRHRLHRDAVTAVCAYAALRVAGVLALWLAATARGRDVSRILTAWDGQWYAGIAAHGYGFTRLHPDGRLLSDYAFFPFYPLGERLASAVTGLSPADAGLVVSATAAVVAAWGIFVVARHVLGPRPAVLVVVLWAALPVSVVQTMAYSESLFTALAAWALWATPRRRWVLAGALAAAGALTRPTGLAIAAAVVVSAAIELWHARTRSSRRSGPGRPSSAAVGLLLAGVGSVAYPAWVGVRVGSPLGYFRVTAGWGNTLDGGAAFARWTWAHLSHPASALAGVLLVLAVAVLVALLVVCVRRGYPPALIVYAAGIVVLSLVTSGYFGSKPRYLLPAFPLLFPVATWIASRHRWQRWSLMCVAAAFSLAYGTVWLLGPGPP